MKIATLTAWILTATMAGACARQQGPAAPEPLPATTTTLTSTHSDVVIARELSADLLATREAANPGGVVKPRVRLTDAEIGYLMETVNGAEIEEGTLAQKSGRNAAVRAHAKRMVEHHTSARDRQAALFSKLAMGPAESLRGREIRLASDRNQEALRALSGDDFDQAYLSVHIRQHEELLAALDEALPTVQSAEYKAMLEPTRERLAQHLQAARELRASMGW